MDKKIRNIQRKIRKMTWSQKLALFDWLNMWYENYKKEQQMLYDEYMREEE